MRAVTFAGPESIEVVDKPVPELDAPHEALIRIRASGICGSDLHIYHGRVAVEPGFTLGHEYVAEIVETGDAVTELSRGDRVVGSFQAACGTCQPCRRGDYHKCDRARTFGHGAVLGALPGTQAEFAVVPYANVTLRRVPESVPDDVALFAGDVMATAYHATTSVSPGDAVAVLGLGPVGLSAVQAAIIAGAAQVLAIDSVRLRLEMARSFGAVPIHLTEQSPRDEVKRLTEGHGVRLTVEAVGNAAALDMALRLTAKGGTVNLIGVYAERIEMNAAVAWIKSINLRMGHANVLRHLDAVLALLSAGRLDPRPLVTHHMSLNDAAEAYALYDRREALKIVLNP